MRPRPRPASTPRPTSPPRPSTTRPWRSRKRPRPSTTPLLAKKKADEGGRPRRAAAGLREGRGRSRGEGFRRGLWRSLPRRPTTPPGASPCRHGGRRGRSRSRPPQGPRVGAIQGALFTFPGSRIEAGAPSLRPLFHASRRPTAELRSQNAGSRSPRSHTSPGPGSRNARPSSVPLPGGGLRVPVGRIQRHALGDGRESPPARRTHDFVAPQDDAGGGVVARVQNGVGRAAREPVERHSRRNRLSVSRCRTMGRPVLVAAEDGFAYARLAADLGHHAPGLGQMAEGLPEAHGLLLRSIYSIGGLGYPHSIAIITL